MTDQLDIDEQVEKNIEHVSAELEKRLVYGRVFAKPQGPIVVRALFRWEVDMYGERRALELGGYVLEPTELENTILNLFAAFRFWHSAGTVGHSAGKVEQ